MIDDRGEIPSRWIFAAGGKNIDPLYELDENNSIRRGWRTRAVVRNDRRSGHRLRRMRLAESPEELYVQRVREQFIFFAE